MKVEKEGLIIAAEIKSLLTKNYQANIRTNKTQDVDCANKILNQLNLVSSCPIQTLIVYRGRYNKIGHYIYWKYVKIMEF